MNFDGGVFMIIKPSTLHVFIFKGEAKWLNQVKGATSVRTQADDVACVGGYFGMDKNNVKHSGK